MLLFQINDISGLPDCPEFGSDTIAVQASVEGKPKAAASG
jgi:hypothetical protein